MIRPGFLSSADRLKLEACVRRQREDHGIARRAAARRRQILPRDEICPKVGDGPHQAAF